MQNQNAAERSVPEGYAARKALANQLGVSLRTLDLWHEKRIGPPRTCVGKQVWYRVEGVRDWLQSREQ